jgi:hypothetical protein
VLAIDTTKERIESKGGLILAGKLAGLMGLMNIVSPVIKSCGKVLTELFAALVQGESDFGAIKPLRNSELVQQAFGLDSALSENTVRIYTDTMTCTPCQVAALASQIQDSSLRLLSQATFIPIRTKRKEYIPCDIDTSPMNNEGTKKENIGFTYKGFEGYHPIFAYPGAEGYMLSCELRPGNQHCREAKKAYREGRNIIIKRNLRQENKEIWLETAKEYGSGKKVREGKMRYTGKVKPDCPVNNRYPSVDVVFEVIERTIDRIGQALILPEIEVNTFWSNVKESAGRVIELYHDHGTMEQFHSELKTDMGLEKFPSGKYGVNQIILQMGMCAYNALRYIGQGMLEEKEVLPIKQKEGTVRKRLVHVIRYIIQMAGKLVRHAGKVVFKIYDNNEWLPVFRILHARIQEL